MPSQIYVKNKEKNAKEVGINSDIIRYAKDVSEQEVLKKIKELNNNEAVSGILVQFFLSKVNTLVVCKELSHYNRTRDFQH